MGFDCPPVLEQEARKLRVRRHWRSELEHLPCTSFPARLLRPEQDARVSRIAAPDKATYYHRVHLLESVAERDRIAISSFTVREQEKNGYYATADREFALKSIN